MGDLVLMVQGHGGVVHQNETDRLGCLNRSRQLLDLCILANSQRRYVEILLHFQHKSPSDIGELW